MKATIELRSRLNELGVRYETSDESEHTTRVRINGKLIQFYELAGSISVTVMMPDFEDANAEPMTAEQAIEATVGEMVCSRVFHPNRTSASGPRYTCSVCGYGASDRRWLYCPKCGRMYTDDGEPR